MCIYKHRRGCHLRISVFALCLLEDIMENIIKEALGTVTLKPSGKGGGGCINDGEAYFTDTGTIFVKRNSKSQAKRMFDGEFESLKAIGATNTIAVPQPLAVLDNPHGGAVIAMEYIDMKGLRKYSKELGHQLAKLHLYNSEVAKANKKGFVGKEDNAHVDKFGFHVTTCCGYLPLENEWCDNWTTFFIRQRLEPQFRMIEKNYADSETMELWSELQLKIDKFFEGVKIEPSLLHGDLWSGNMAETISGPVIFDPASFYGHHEYEFGIISMFGGFPKSFFDGYFEVIPKDPGFNSRNNLYQLFHNLNHWNHFGKGYRGSSLSLIKALLK